MVAPVSGAFPFIATTVIGIRHHSKAASMIDITTLFLAFLLSQASATIGGNRRVHVLPEQVIGHVAIVVEVSNIRSEVRVSVSRASGFILYVLPRLQTFTLVLVGCSITATYLFLGSRTVTRLMYTLP
jgi:hypothetical protein